jgi:hypothetical protein
MRLRVEGAPLPDVVVMLLSHHGFEVVRDAQADGSVRLEEDKIVLTLPGPDEDALAAQAVSALNMLAAALPDAVAALSASAKAAAAARRRRGRRTGPRPVKPRRRALERIAVLRAEGSSLRDIARVLEAEGYPPPSGKTWYATTVKRAQETGLAETRIVLKRLGQILAEIHARGSVDDAELRELGREHGFHHHRLHRVFEERVDPPRTGRFTPLLHHEGGRYLASPKGLEMLAMWQCSEKIHDEIGAFLLSVRRRPMTSEKAFFLLCLEKGVTVDEVVPRFLTSGARAELTDEGKQVADTWRRIVDPDPRERLDIDFWPTPEEEERLNPDWDWEDDPLAS